MAVVDQKDPAIVLGVVYDGPPEAGKTTSVRALARSFGREVFTPEEQDGRTVYFDWLEHTGGRFDGAPLRCQIMSVPGQKRWADRRLHLLARADVVVFVGDTSRGSWPLTLARLRELCAWLAEREGPPVGIVFQANRRDAPDAVPIAELRADTGSARVAIVESVAVDGSGVREAFVFAVRLALDRVREEQRLGSLPIATQRLQGPELLEELRALESPAPRPSAPPRAKELLAVSAGDDASAGLPLLPHHEVPSGLVWPPVEGRILLREAVVSTIEAELTPEGDYRSKLKSGFRAGSPAGATFADMDQARRALVTWARAHAGAQTLLSKSRCIVLAGDADGHFRLWQVVREEPSLRELFVDGAEAMTPRLAARQLASASRVLTAARTRRAEGRLPLSCTLDSIGASDFGEPIYVADMPFPAASAADESPEGVARELSALFAHRSEAERQELGRELLSFQRHEPRFPPGAHIGTLLSRILTSEAVRRIHH